ncbi:MAG TPA: hypothetical protein VF258_06330 [Luteolibacter sp.]
MEGMFSNLYQILALITFPLLVISCREREKIMANEIPATDANGEKAEMSRFYGDTRSLYNNRKYAELEALADDLRSSKAKFRAGTWKIAHFYAAQDCRDEEPESMWRLHEQIHKEWEAKFPKSITARVSHARFMVDYAWQARGSDYADKVTEEGWRLFRERLAQARALLDESKSLAPCPMWWNTRLKVALGQNEKPAAYEALFQEAKKSEPQFFPFDLSRAYYLLPRWHGEPGDWEAAAEKEIERQDGLGFEGYARVVTEQARFYDNVFKQSKASWSKTKKGFDEMHIRYPDSKEILNTYCRMAYFAGDRVQAKKLFGEIGNDKVDGAWRKKGDEFGRARAWALSDK